MRIEDNAVLQSVSALQQLQSLDGSLHVNRNHQLTSLDLPEVGLGPGATVELTDNPALLQCPLQTWATARAAMGWPGTPQLSGNLGCGFGQLCQASACAAH